MLAIYDHIICFVLKTNQEVDWWFVKESQKIGKLTGDPTNVAGKMSEYNPVTRLVLMRFKNYCNILYIQQIHIVEIEIL